MDVFAMEKDHWMNHNDMLVLFCLITLALLSIVPESRK